jgi:predicted small metal-binding protein
MCDYGNQGIDPVSDSVGVLRRACSDAEPKNCDWQVSGNSEPEIMPKIEQHGREKQNMTIADSQRSSQPQRNS